ncbi:hypothetical protein Tsubulata_042739 [Turnera subulata]|uniref:LysM domain-containing protein n=1 Tax=Turnera subulata TaxID=218843 RepID=A0A9Q0G6J7_9ROSI|nr:hypothetical protein Tsubulata_042739 [Turnera subulata]
MATSNQKFAIFFNVLVILSLAIFVSTAQSRIYGGGSLKPQGINCDKVHAVNSGETCFAIKQAFHLSDGFFNSINPNLNCDDLFIGQWICLHGSENF